ncbi:MAG: DUF4012 domain-containing protein [Candidatus Levybacteria bacterium]|nr:DUF4012 domain-containing protein [Candidatus Levybacteria bacterium]
MTSLSFATIERKHTPAHEQILIVDKRGTIGSLLVNELANQVTTVFITQNHYLAKDAKNRTVLVPFQKKIPDTPHAAYSHIIVVYGGKKTILTFAQSLYKESLRQKATFMFVLPYVFASDDVIMSALGFGKESRVVVVGEMFGKPVGPIDMSSIDAMLLDAKNMGRITIENMGLLQVRPVYAEDATYGILHICFGQQSTSQIFYVFPKQTYTMLSIAHILQKIDPLIRVDFIKGEEISSGRFTPGEEGEYVIGQRYPLAQKIKDAWIKTEKNVKTLALKRRVDKPKKLVSSMRFIAIVIIIILALPLTGAGFFSLAGGYKLRKAQQESFRGNVSSAAYHAKGAQRFFQAAVPFSRALSWEAALIGKEEKTDALKNAIATGKEAAVATEAFISGALGVWDVLYGKTARPQETIRDATNNLKDALLIVQKWQMKNASALEQNPFIPKTFFQTITDKQAALDIQILTSILPVLPDLLGVSGTKQYLILFQNNTELRPGGGFIGSYGILSMEKGRVLGLELNDVYDADGQLKGHVEPPFAIRRHLPSVHWYLRDSNFDADFTRVASTAAFFLRAETGREVDGVIGVDVSFVQKLLQATGPVYVSDYKETVSTENFYERTQAHAQEDFFPGSTQKKDFLRSLSRAIITRIVEEESLSYGALVKALREGILEKHILFGFQDKSLQSLFAANNLSSSLPSQRQKKENTLYDFLGISEANLGVNKVNRFIKRKVAYNASINKEGVVTGTITVKFANESKKNNLYEGDYKNYLRFILPQGARVSSIAIDGKEQDIVAAVTDPQVYERKNFTPPAGLEVEETEQDGNTTLGFLVVIPKSVIKTINVTYALPDLFSVNNPAPGYDLSFFKQPGTEPYSFSFSLSYPSFLVLRDGHTPLFTDVLLGDKAYVFSFTTK